jgi:hypothetical protein
MLVCQSVPLLVNLNFRWVGARKDAVWALALFAKSTASFVMALTLTTDHFLLLSPVINYGTDVLLVLWSFRYGYSNLGHYANMAPVEQPAG